MNTYYKAIILAINAIETTIEDERHFCTRREAEIYAERSRSGDRVAVVVEMQA